jgi:hypothetical protein
MAIFNSVKLSRPGFMQGLGNAAIYDDTVNVAGSLANGDVINIMKVNAGCRLSLLSLFTPGGLGTGTVVKLGYAPLKASAATRTPAVDNYFGANVSAFAAATTNGQAFEPCFAPITFDDDVVITATVTTAPGTTTPGAITGVAMGDMVGIK